MRWWTLRWTKMAVLWELHATPAADQARGTDLSPDRDFPRLICVLCQQASTHPDDVDLLLFLFFLICFVPTRIHPTRHNSHFNMQDTIHKYTFNMYDT